MVFRLDTTCPRCRKENSVFGQNFFCDDCVLVSFMRRTIKQSVKEKRMREELNQMKPAIREKLHEKLLKEVLAELDAQDKKGN